MKILRRVGTVLWWSLGFAFPLLALGLELWTHDFSGGLYDIIPTPWHALLWLCMPLSFVLVELQLKQQLQRTWLVSFIQGLTLPVIVLHLIAVGGLALIGLLGFVFACADGVLSLLLRDHYADFFRSFAVTSLIAITPLTTVVCWIRNSWRIAQKRQIRSRFLLSGIVFSLVILVVLEVPAVQTRDLIASTTGQIDIGREPTLNTLVLLSSPRCQQAIARLAYSGMQFSSAGELYPVGPVDVFGPLAFILDGRRVPAYASDRLVMKQPQMLRLFKLTHLDDPSAEPVPSSWRGLSSGEKARLNSE